MTDQPATAPAPDRVTALTLRIGDLREQRDQARAERDDEHKASALALAALKEMHAERDEARAQVVACQTADDDLRQERDDAYKAFTIAKDALNGVLRQLDQERALAVREIDPDVRRRALAAIAPWPPGVRKGDVIRAIGEGK